jgi:hypothetical protein
MRCTVHQSIVYAIRDKFQISRFILPKDLQGQTMLMWGEDCYRMWGEWGESGKRPDLAIQVRNTDGEYDIKFVLEAGLSESYVQLVEDAKLWLGGTDSVSMVSLIR